MGLRLTVGAEDKVIMSCGIVIDIVQAGKEVKLNVEAPADIKIHTIFKDSSKQFKNRRRKAL